MPDAGNVFDVSSGAGYRRLNKTDATESDLIERCHDFGQYFPSDGGVADDSASADARTPRFELWLDQEDPRRALISEVGELLTNRSQ